MLNLLNDHKLDNEYVTNQKFIELIKEISGITCKLNTNLASVLIERNNEILVFIKEYFESHEFIGDEKILNNYDFLIILACGHKKIQEKRVSKAINLYNKAEPNSRVVFSGGGSWCLETESEVMKKQFCANISECNFIKEEYSMDTVGNALFSKLILKEKKLLTRNAKIVVVTSEFHALRTQAIFTKIFHDSEILIVTADTISDSDFKKNIEWIRHELNSEYINDDFYQINYPQCNQRTLSSDAEFLLNLFHKHDLYKKRYDLIRRFSEFI